MQELQTHFMQLAVTHASGEEEWLCPICGRRFLLHWPPDYRKVILEPGDEYATHSGSKGDLHMGTLSLTEVDPLFATDLRRPVDRAPIDTRDLADDIAAPLTDELRPWAKWIDQADRDGSINLE